MFATQPVYNAGRAAHALRSDQYMKIILGLVSYCKIQGAPKMVIKILAMFN